MFFPDSPLSPYWIIFIECPQYTPPTHIILIGVVMVSLLVSIFMLGTILSYIFICSTKPIAVFLAQWLPLKYI